MQFGPRRSKKTGTSCSLLSFASLRDARLETADEFDDLMVLTDLRIHGPGNLLRGEAAKRRRVGHNFQVEIRERAAGRSTLAGRNCLGVLQGAAIVHTENLLEDAVQVVNGIEFRAEVGGQLCPRELQRIALNDLRNQVGRLE